MIYRRIRALTCVTLLSLCCSVFAQQESNDTSAKVESKTKQEQTKPAPVVTEGGVIQLEAVIRGNQQQPKVLTIVPWQSPERRNTLPSPVWQQVRQQLQPLERRNFLQEQQFFEKLLKR